MNDEIKAIRHALGSIDVSDIDEAEMTEQERKSYCSQISAVFPLIEKDIKRAMRDEILMIAEADNWEKVNYGRGTCNGISLLYELWKKVNAEHISNLNPEGKGIEPHSPIGEI